MKIPFQPEDFTRLDETSDSQFYSLPRKVVHIGDAAILAVKQFLREVMPHNGIVLDLLSSWRSHWPAEIPKAQLIGLGLNAEEMEDNPDLTDYIVHDVNTDPCLPFEHDTFDAVVITVSIQYLTQPIEVFRDVNRILKPQGLFAVLFSNRMFPTKAIAIWRALNDQQHIQLVQRYFQHAGNFGAIEASDRSPKSAGDTDPLYAVLGRKSPR
ncbi:MAG: methyltransferase domain-containing protein [bacterium]|nr:methyltransferase domain-containing protein [bacterium]